jgi:hypothetical protein
MARRTGPTALCIAALASGLLSACGGGSSGNGIESKSASAILASAVSAAEGAKTVHVSGYGTTEGSKVKIDLALDRENGAKGSITKGKLSVHLIRVGSRAYINGGAELYEQYGGPEAAKLLKGKWLEASATSGELAALNGLTNLKALLGDLEKGHSSSLDKGSVQTVDGKKAIAITDKQKGGTLYVATTGKPYPIELVKTGSEGGRFTFSEWDKPISISPPPQSSVLNVEKLEEEVGG